MRTIESNLGRRIWLTHYAPLIIWIVVILGLGSSMGSMNETSRFIRPLLDFLFPSASPETLTFIHGIIRKLAHFIEYAVLGFFAIRALLAFEYGRLKAAVVAFVIAAAVASLDEFQQSFNPLRTSSTFDVLIDLAGALSGLSFVYLAKRRTAKGVPSKTI